MTKARYRPYILRQEGERLDLLKNEAIEINNSIDYGDIFGLDIEARNALSVARPTTLVSRNNLGILSFC